jgi:hypothetical protein
MKTSTTISVLEALRSGGSVTLTLPTSVYSLDAVQRAIKDAQVVCDASIVEQLSSPLSVTVTFLSSAGGNTISVLCDNLLRSALSDRGFGV